MALKNSHGHPRKKAIQKLLPFLAKAPSHEIRWCEGQNNCSAKILTVDFYSTATSGTIIVSSDGEKYWITQTQGRSIE